MTSETDHDPPKLLDDLFERLAVPFTADELMDELADVVYFVKNAAGQYVAVNQALVSRCGRTNKHEVLGRTAEELFPAPYGRAFLEQDRALIASGLPLRQQLEVHLYKPAGPGWCLTTKLPLKGKQGDSVGLVGISRDLQTVDEDAVDLGSVAAVVDHIRTHLAEPLRTADLAKLAGLSTWQLDQRVRHLFQMSISQLVLQSRMQLAARQLSETERPISAIALAVGYSDQSAFSRQFRNTTGLTPGEFRRNRTV